MEIRNEKERAALDAAFARIDEYAPEAYALNARLAAHPEISGEERASCEAFCEILELHGVAVEREFCGVPHAFRARVCDAEGGPKVGILAEYDALPEIGHACGHCASGSLSLLAALALHGAAETAGATVDIIGTPDEEVEGRKIDMAKAGAFDGYDFVIMIHMDSKNKVESKFLALSAFRYNFRGAAAHAAASPWAGRNALNGAMLMIHAFDMLRQHLRPSTRVHGIIAKGGEASNIVPEFASAEYLFRSPDSRYLAEILPALHDCARGAALATQTEVEIEEFSQPFDSMKPNPAGTAPIREIYESLGLDISEEDIDGAGSSDIGNVSFRCAAFHPTLAVCDEGVAAHTREFAAAMTGERIEKVISTGARVICGMIIRAAYEPERLEAIRRDFRKG